MMSDLTGKLLIAMPSIGDSRFSRSVVLVCAHEPEYAMGIVLNKPIDDLTLPQLLSQLGIEQDIKIPDSAVLNGGPVGITAHVLQTGGVEAHQAAYGVEQVQHRRGGRQQVILQRIQPCYPTIQCRAQQDQR